MNKDYAAQLLLQQAQTESDPETAMAMVMGARELSRGELAWVPVELREWLFNVPEAY